MQQIANHLHTKNGLYTLCLWAVLALPLQTNAQPNAADPVAETTTIAVPGAGLLGGPANMLTHIYKPPGDGPHPVVLFSHGRAGDAAGRARLKNPVQRGHVKYWLAKGYAVVAPVRPGYGDTGGTDDEGSGLVHNQDGVCIHPSNPGKTAKAAVYATQHALQWLREQPWAHTNRIILAGQSVGGLATVALCATNPPGVVGCINFSGGTGGNPLRAPARMCAPENMTALVTEYGKTTKLPNIWFYAENDQYWGAEPPKQWHAAFAAGASPTELVATGPVESDGHRLLSVGGRLWSVPLNAWLRKQRF